jgi:hypothetical protein
MRNRRAILPGIVAVVAIVGASINHREILSQRRENWQLQQIANEADRFDQRENRKMSDSPADENIEILRAETSELHKLRAEVQRLRGIEKEIQPLRDWNMELHRLVNQGSDPKAQEPIPFIAASELRPIDRSTPEAAVQSLLFALREGRLDEVTACMTPLSRAGDPYPTYITRIISNFYGDAAWTAEDKTIELKAFAAGLNSFRIIERTPAGSGKVELTLHMTTLDPQGNLQDLTGVNLEAILIDSNWTIGPGRERHSN